MLDKGSVFQKGGGGTNFEQAVQTAFLTTLIIRGNAPLNFSNEIIEVAFQTTNRGYETDDLLVVTKSDIGVHKILVQIKNNIAFTKNNALFKEVLVAFWKDYNNASLFDKTKDKLLIIKSGITSDERNHLKSLFNWARTHATEIDFITEVNRINVKKDKLEIFRESLKVVNNNIALSDKEIWEFLKCFDVIEYDFTNINSVDEAYFLNLIKLSKSSDSNISEKNIWDSIYSFVSKLNPNGGSVTSSSILKEEFYKNFDISKLSPYFKRVEKLKSDSEVILLPFKNTIGGFHLEREKISQSIAESVNDFQFSIVTGKPGVGKSAQIRDVLKNEFPSASIFVFRADQFSEPHIANVFSSQGVNETLQDIFSCISLIPEKIIFIDSLEKLLEADPECAFKQLLTLVKQFPDIKIIGSSRKYAVDLITQKFGIDKTELGRAEVLPLDDTELNIIAEKFPQLQSILKNEKIKKLLQSPKYLDFAILALNKSNDDYTNISLTEFKDKLWNSLVKDSTNRKKGFPAKREDAFMEIAINRAKEMKLFTKAERGDMEAIDLLENDEIIFQENDNRRYSPTHDILEDWALVKHISSKHEEFPNPKELFDNLGNEPAIRRAFRLWIEDYLIDDSNKINELVRATISNTSIEGYWADEILIAVFKSDNCGSFFSAFEKDLLDSKTYFHFLNRCIHLIKTACKESSLNRNNFSILLPIGSGWREMMSFLSRHINELNFLSRSICNFLSDWNCRLMFQSSQTEEQEKLDAKEIVLHYLKQVESGEDIWQNEFMKDKPKELVSILFQLAPIAKLEIEELIERAFKNKEDRNSWKLNSFYEKVIDSCISGYGNCLLIKELPELVVQTAWREWKPRKIVGDQEHRGISSMIRGNRLDGDECWGLGSKHGFFPSGIYKTPLYNLLWNHPLVGLKFVTEIINYSIDFYVKAECDYKHQFTEIEIELNDGTKVKQWAGWEFWAAYRGSSVTHYAIESLLMSLEKYLLETAAQNTDTSKSNLKFMFNYLLLHSNNVSITSVLTSVAIAYPEEVEEAMLPLLSIEEFYEWDLSRAFQESSTFAPIDNDISFAQKERWETNQLPHRKKYMRGLGDFIVDYQFNIRKLNTEIHKLFDKLQARIKSDNIIWKKRLSEIDVRKWEVKMNDEEHGKILIQPKYEEDVSTFMNSNQDYFEAQYKSSNYSSIISKAYELKEAINFEIWKECYLHYLDEKNFNFLLDRYVSVSIIGLRDFESELTVEQKQWCLEKIKNSITDILDDTFSHNYELTKSYSLMEKEIALSSFHYLFSHTKTEKETSELIALMIYTLSAPFNDYEIDNIIEYVRTIFFEKFPNELKRIWCCLIKYSEFKKSSSSLPNNYDSQKLKAKKIKEQKFIEKQSQNINTVIDIATLNLKNNDGFLLARVFVITPYNSSENLFSDFIKHFIPLLTEDLKFEDNYSYNRNSSERQINSSAILDAEGYLSDLILYSSSNLSDYVIVSLIESTNSITSNHTLKDIVEFISKTLQYVVLKIYDLGNSIQVTMDYLKHEKKFWLTWRLIFETIKESKQFALLPTLFFKIRYLLNDTGDKPNGQNWKALDSENGLFKEMVLEFKEKNIVSHMIAVFSTVGEKYFLPEGISWLVDIYKIDINATASLIAPTAERMIERLFYNHISKIKSNNKLIEDYLWILNRMVDLGSSEAYLFRENVITYKSNK